MKGTIRIKRGLTVLVSAALLFSCNGLGVKVDAVPVEKALLEYFEGGYVPYSLPGHGEIFKPGAIIRYRKGAEVLVRKSTDCFALETTSGVRLPPSVDGQSSTEIGGALGLFLPKAAATDLSTELKRSKVTAVKLDFGTLVTRQIPEGLVEDEQIKRNFPQKCKQQYGQQKILVLGTIGSKTVRYTFSENSAFETGIEAASKLKIGGGVTVKKSADYENTMEVISDTIIWMGYLPYELKKEGLLGKDIGQEPELTLEKLTVEKALEMKYNTK